MKSLNCLSLQFNLWYYCSSSVTFLTLKNQLGAQMTHMWYYKFTYQYYNFCLFLIVILFLYAIWIKLFPVIYIFIMYQLRYHDVSDPSERLMKLETVARFSNCLFSNERDNWDCVKSSMLQALVSELESSNCLRKVDELCFKEVPGIDSAYKKPLLESSDPFGF